MRTFVIIAIVVAVGLYNNAIEALTDRHYTPASIMIYSSIFSILFILLFSTTSNRKNIIPKANKSLLIRIITNGCGVFFLYSSYKYLAASSVAIVQRMDIPLLILIAVLRGKTKSSLQFWLSFWAILLFTFFIINFKFIDEDPIGFGLAFVGVLFLSSGYIILKKDTEKETIFSLSITYSLSILLGGLAAKIYLKEVFIFPLADLWIFISMGLIYSFMVIAGISLLKWYETEKARLPFIIGAFATLIFEMIFEKKIFNINQIGLSVLIVGIITTISLNPATPKLKLRN